MKNLLLFLIVTISHFFVGSMEAIAAEAVGLIGPDGKFIHRVVEVPTGSKVDQGVVLETFPNSDFRMSIASDGKGWDLEGSWRGEIIIEGRFIESFSKKRNPRTRKFAMSIERVSTVEVDHYSSYGYSRGYKDNIKQQPLIILEGMELTFYVYDTMARWWNDEKEKVLLDINFPRNVETKSISFEANRTEPSKAWFGPYRLMNPDWFERLKDTVTIPFNPSASILRRCNVVFVVVP